MSIASPRHPRLLPPSLWGAAVGAVLGFAPETVRAAPPVRATFDVRYAPGRDRQKLDVFAPEGGSNRPVVLFVHGGAWMFGDKNLFGLYRGVGQYLARNGIVAVAVNYNLSPKVRHPEHVRDLARAFAWVRRHARDYGGDPDRIVLVGHSAGGHLVSLLAADPTHLNDPDLGLKESDRAALRAVVGVCGIYRIPDADEFLDMLVAMLRGLPIPEKLGKMMMRRSEALNPFRVVFGDGEAIRAEASPLTHARKGLPPFLLLTATSDVPRLPAMAEAFGKALTDQGVAAEVRRMEGTNHNTILFKLGKKDDAVGPLLLQFIERHAGRPASRP